MKKLIGILFLCSSILLHGCYSYSAITSEDVIARYPLPEEKFLIKLNDGSTIECQPKHHFYTTEKADFIYGIGELKHRVKNIKQSWYVGELLRESIDSLVLTSSGDHRYLICYLFDNKVVSFQEGDYIIVTPDQDPGLWCAGIRTFENQESIFSGKISTEDFKNIETKKIDKLRTTILVAGILGAGIIYALRNFKLVNIDGPLLTD